MILCDMPDGSIRLSFWTHRQTYVRAEEGKTNVEVEIVIQVGTLKRAARPFISKTFFLPTCPY